MLNQILIGILGFIPALVANPLAVVFGGGRPIDGGRKIGGKRILGDGKTWRGLFGGGLSGGFIGLILYLGLSSVLNFYPSFSEALIIAFSFSFGALLGDIFGSLIKRRLGKKRGEMVLGIDQYDFLVGAFLVSLIIESHWIIDTYFEGDGWITLLILIIGVPLLHRVINIIGYKIGLKKEPW